MRKADPLRRQTPKKTNLVILKMLRDNGRERVFGLRVRKIFRRDDLEWLLISEITKQLFI